MEITGFCRQFRILLLAFALAFLVSDCPPTYVQAAVTNGWEGDRYYVNGEKTTISNLGIKHKGYYIFCTKIDGETQGIFL